MKQYRPFIITLIADLNLLGAILSALSLFINFTEKSGIEFRILYFLPSKLLSLLTSIVLFIISYGLLKLKPWAYWLMIFINVLFLIASIIYSLQTPKLPSYQGIAASIITLIFVIPTKRYFARKPYSS